MSKKQDLIAALECKKPCGAVPIWELEFHAWEKFASKAVIVGREFESLSSSQQEWALYTNAETMHAVAEKLNFASLTVPNSYWEIALAEPACFWLPENARYRQIEVLHKLIGGCLLLVGICGGVLGMPASAEYVEFAYKLHDRTEDKRRTVMVIK